MAEFTVETNSGGLAVIPEPVFSGDTVQVRVKVVNPPHYDWGPVKSIRESYPLEHLTEVPMEMVEGKRFTKTPFDESKVEGPVLKEDGLVAVYFEMPKCLSLELHFSVEFYRGAVILDSTERDNPTVSYKTRIPKTIQVKLFCADPPLPE